MIALTQAVKDFNLAHIDGLTFLNISNSRKHQPNFENNFWEPQQPFSL